MDQKKLDEFLANAVGEWGAALDALLIFVGERLGLYRAMVGDEGPTPITPEILANNTGTHPRMIKEWLIARAAGGDIEYEPMKGTFILPKENAFALIDENSPG